MSLTGTPLILISAVASADVGVALQSRDAADRVKRDVLGGHVKPPRHQGVAQFVEYDAGEHGAAVLETVSKNVSSPGENILSMGIGVVLAQNEA